MMKASWNNAVIAESDDIVMVEGNAYFPLDSIVDEYFEPSDHTSVCGWKGTASYYDVVVHGDRNAKAAWYYPDPKPDANNIKDRVAFWNGVTVDAT